MMKQNAEGQIRPSTDMY